MQVFQSNQSDSFVPSIVRYSHDVSRELKMQKDDFHGLGMRFRMEKKGKMLEERARDVT